jgi:hypothetical protein
MEKWFEVVAAALALIAAGFWFASAWGHVPPPVAYLGDRAPDWDPFYKAVQFSALMNTFAASFSGASALSWALGRAGVFGLRGR